MRRSASLNEAGVDSRLVDWINDMLAGQSVTAKIGTTSKTVQVCRGTPQGGVLSPLLFSCVMNRLLNNLTQVPGIYSQAYADDVVILASGIDSRTLSESLEEALSVVDEWCETVGLQLNINKTTVTMFTWQRKWIYHPVRFQGNDIMLVDNVTYLGVTLNAKLNWTKHIAERVEKANRCLAVCRQQMGTVPKGHALGIHSYDQTNN